MSEQNYLTTNQAEIVNELCETHGLEPEQISFDGKDEKPIFDFEAISALSLKLTDIVSIDCDIIEKNKDSGEVTCRCTVYLPDGRSRSITESATVGEILHDQNKISSLRIAEAVARSRALRTAIRLVGINLFKAHKKMLEIGEIAEGHTNHDPRYPDYQNIKTIAKKLDFIYFETIDGKKVENKTHYEKLLADNFDGKTSLTELDDLQLKRCKILFRSLDRVGFNPNEKVAA